MATQPQGDIFNQLASGQTPQAAPPKASAAAPGDIFDTLASGGTSTPPSQAAPSGSKDTWTNWSADQPLTSYGAATRGAVGGLIDDTLNAVKGAVSFFDPRPQNDGEKSATAVTGPGGLYMYRMLNSLSPVARAAIHPTEIAAAIHEINSSKDPTGTYLKIAQKTASQGAGQAVTALGTAGVAKALPAVADVAGKTVDAVKNSDIVQGAGKAQAPATSALRAGAEASAADAGVAAGDTSGSIRSMLDDPIEELSTKERASYDTINKASGTDLKSLYDHANDVQDALDDPTNIAQRTVLQKDLQTTQSQIADGEAKARANGVDPDMLNDAKEMTKQRYAMETINQKLFNNESVVKGNLEHGAPESINVDSAIRQVENLDKPSKFAPRGTPSRLQQALGEDGANSLKQGLYDAQKAGQSAVTKQTIAKWVGGVAAGAVGAREISHLAALMP